MTNVEQLLEDKHLKPGDEPHKEDEMKWFEWKFNLSKLLEWKEKKKKWSVTYEGTYSFICGFEGEIPKVFGVNSKYRVPLDISLDYSVDQTNTVITKAIVNSVKQNDTHNHHVFLSARPIVRDYIKQSDYFKRGRLVRWKCVDAKREIMRLGIHKNFYVYCLFDVENVDVFLKRTLKKYKNKGDFGLTEILVGKSKLTWLVCQPTYDIVKRMWK
ncbi:hypothetical protein FRX31_032183 [Thalictrum thalictroides]|uniref:Uncharacterized protein n=1 Tax=Thalictrum thalictroides TaxID=46969 RepID=A0A7J6V1K0_THATH|nr:hypothetical protein FRX31_032183 [Thalictrum thalictroides]